MAPLMGHGNKLEGGGNFFYFHICLQCKGQNEHKQNVVEWVDGEEESRKEK